MIYYSIFRSITAPLQHISHVPRFLFVHFCFFFAAYIDGLRVKCLIVTDRELISDYLATISIRDAVDYCFKIYDFQINV